LPDGTLPRKIKPCLVLGAVTEITALGCEQNANITQLIKPELVLGSTILAPQKKLGNVDCLSKLKSDWKSKYFQWVRFLH